MEFGAHLPLIAFYAERFSLQRIIDYAETARRLGYEFLCANDHLVFPRPWLDGPTALAAVLSHTGRMRLATTLSIPTVRGPVQLAKTLAAIDLMSGGRLVVGVGPGSSPRDYDLVGVPFEERWKRFDEAVGALRALFEGRTPFKGKFYNTEGVKLEPYPAQRPWPPLWLGSWGSEKPVFDALHASVTAGSRQDTTLRRKSLQRLGVCSADNLTIWARTPMRSRTLSQRCSTTLLRIGARQSA